MGCSASTTKGLDPGSFKERPPLKMNENGSKDKCDDISEHTTPTINDQSDGNLSTADLGKFTSERKESSLPEVDKDLKMDQQKAAERDVEIRVEGRPEEQDEIEDTDSFDVGKDPLSREKMSSIKVNSAMKETMEFIYQNSSSSSPSHLGGGFPKFYTNSPRHTNRRPSGVPPPPRAFKESDVLAKFGDIKDQRKPSVTAEEEELSEEEQEGVNLRGAS